MAPRGCRYPWPASSRRLRPVRPLSDDMTSPDAPAHAHPYRDAPAAARPRDDEALLTLDVSGSPATPPSMGEAASLGTLRAGRGSRVARGNRGGTRGRRRRGSTRARSG